ncbi:MAG: EfeM/EfeO family lipoprotein [Caldilinea sp. CFX5]|nr:EfeM/EfeO family lipoprotein [Caldilinea sp. CFX5]
MVSVSRTKVLVMALVFCLLAACTTPAAPTSAGNAESATAPQPDLTGIKTYLLEKTTTLRATTTTLRQLGDRYYTLAKEADFDYAMLWQNRQDELKTTVLEARAAWIKASPLYEQMEGIVAGTPSLAEYDVILDAGSSGAEDPENAVPFDLTLPDGRVLPKPGNLFGVLESTLWGTFADYTATGVQPDFDANGAQDLGDALPDANVFKAAADALDSYATELATAAEAWQPTTAEAFSALVVMVPTMNEYFGSWRDSRFVTGEASTQRDFVAISRLADIQDILGGLQVVYAEVQPMVVTVDAAQAEQIATGLQALKEFVAGIHQQENEGKRFTPEEADLLGTEAQNRATAITGQVSQAAAQLKITIEE